jgi:hypothetical protein
VPVVLATAFVPLITMNTPATTVFVPELIANETAADVAFEPAEAAEKAGTRRFATIDGSVQLACEAIVSAAALRAGALRPMWIALCAAPRSRNLSRSEFLPTVVTRLSNSSRQIT